VGRVVASERRAGNESAPQRTGEAYGSNACRMLRRRSQYVAGSSNVALMRGLCGGCRAGRQCNAIQKGTVIRHQVQVNRSQAQSCSRRVVATVGICCVVKSSPTGMRCTQAAGGVLAATRKDQQSRTRVVEVVGMARRRFCHPVAENRTAPNEPC